MPIPPIPHIPRPRYYLSHSATQTDSFEISLHAKSSNSPTWNGRMIHAILFAFVGDQSGSTFCGASHQNKVLALLGAIPFILKTLRQHNWLYFLHFDWTRGLLMWILCTFKANSPEQPHFLPTKKHCAFKVGHWKLQHDWKFIHAVYQRAFPISSIIAWDWTRLVQSF